MKLLFDTTGVAINAIMDGDYSVMKARGRRAYRVKMKLLFVATAADEITAAIDVIMDGDYAVMKACGHHGAMCGGKCKNKGFKGTNICTKRSGVAVIPVHVPVRFSLMTMAMRTPLLRFGGR